MKRLNLRSEIEEKYIGSDLQKIVNHNPLPIKYTIEGFDCYFHNADLFGLFELKIIKEGLSPDDFSEDYKNGFKAGLKHLKKKEEIDVKDLKNTTLRDYTISQLKDILHNREFKNGVPGLLNLVFKKLPGVFTDKTIYDYGYWNGIISSIDDLCERAGIKTEDLANASNILESDKEEVAGILENNTNPYPHVFKDSFSYKLFDRLYNEYKNSTNLLADFSFIYRKMYQQEGNYILAHQKPEAFRNWLSEEPFNVVLGNKFKTLDRCTTEDKERNFKAIFDLVEMEQ